MPYLTEGDLPAMGGKPNPGTPADKRLKENRARTTSRKRRAGSRKAKARARRA